MKKVMIMIGALGLFLAPSVFAVTNNAARQPIKPTARIATINGKTYTFRQYVDFFSTLPPSVTSKGLGSTFGPVLEDFLRTQILSGRGMQRRLQNNAEVKRLLAVYQRKLVAAAYFQNVVSQDAKKVSNSQLRSEYAKFVKNFPVTQYSVSHILVKTQAQARRVEADLRAGGDFAVLAKKYSIDRNGQNGGSIGYLNEEVLNKNFDKSVAKLKVGQYTRTPIKTDYGWDIVKINSTRVLSAPSFDAAKDRLRNAIATKEAVTSINKYLTAQKINRYNPQTGAIIKLKAPAKK